MRQPAVPAGRYQPRSTIVFSGVALDTEDGPLDETGLITWTSSLSGTLGTGAELWVSGLLTGTHQIVMTVTHSGGYTGTDEVTIFVGTSAEKVYLPLVLRSYGG